MNPTLVSETSRRQVSAGAPRSIAVWGLRPAILALGLLAVLGSFPAQAAQRYLKLDPDLSRRATASARGTSRVLVRLAPGASLPDGLRPYVHGPKLELIDVYVLSMPDSSLAKLEALPQVVSAHDDRPAWAADYLSVRSTGANVAQQALGLTGHGIGIAVIDSGITTWHDDLIPADGSRYPYANQRVSKFVDFVGGQSAPYDDHGHGSHVAGIIVGNGYDSHGRQAGIAPDASLVSLKVLDSEGRGTISTIISALDWVAANASTYNIRVVNLSVGASVTQSYWIDPLAMAARRLTERGIVVVAAAGNLGQNAAGARQYGGILAPGNAPWVITVGASSTEGTARSQDDVVAGFSSIGPTRGDYLAKPDLVAPGRGVLSLSVPGSTLYEANAQYLVSGNVKLGYPAYLGLSGTSMAAPQVSGAAALMLEANPRLTPNLVKAILQYTARTDASYDTLQQGAGFLNVLGAVRLSRFYALNSPNSRMPVESTWSRHLVWGNQLISGGYINPLANAWANNIVWGTALASTDNIVWGTGQAENIVWGTVCGSADCSNILWGTADATGGNIVWGSGGNIVWGTTTADNIVWGTGYAENIVWGTSGGASENVVWGTACGGDNCANIVWGTQSPENIVWGTARAADNIVWGTADNIVWGTFDASGSIVWGTTDNGGIVWGTADNSNIVWGTLGASDNIVWGTTGNIVWGTAAADNIVWGTKTVDAAHEQGRQ